MIKGLFLIVITLMFINILQHLVIVISPKLNALYVSTLKLDYEALPMVFASKAILFVMILWLAQGNVILIAGLSMLTITETVSLMPSLFRERVTGLMMTLALLVLGAGMMWGLLVSIFAYS